MELLLSVFFWIRACLFHHPAFLSQEPIVKAQTFTWVIIAGCHGNYEEAPSSALWITAGSQAGVKSQSVEIRDLLISGVPGDSLKRKITK